MSHFLTVVFHITDPEAFKPTSDLIFGSLGGKPGFAGASVTAASIGDEITRLEEFERESEG